MLNMLVKTGLLPLMGQNPNLLEEPYFKLNYVQYLINLHVSPA